MKKTIVSDKKKALLTEKERLLQEIKHCEALLEDARSNGNRPTFIDEDSSDSDTEFTVKNIDPSIRQLKHQKSMLKTCYRATQELTGLVVIESQANVMVEDPLVQGHGSEREAGLWREVYAECQINFIHFSITFQTHKADRAFAPTLYRGLCVKMNKDTQGAELAFSVLPTLACPGDAVELLRSYALAQRSRRETLGRLADQFAPALRMDPMPRGGYMVKCGTLLTMEWSLQNKLSPIAPFHHRLKFDLEYVDESYLKRIKQVHMQLADPNMDTDERTLLLSQIMAICLEAQGPTQELYDSLSSDPECAQKMRSRRTTLDQEPEAAVMKITKDSEVMAPPKTLPKKSKKSKGNLIAGRKSEVVKGTGDNGNVGVGKRLNTNETKQDSAKDGAAVATLNDKVGNTAKSVSSSKSAIAKPKSKVSVTGIKKSEAVKRNNENKDVSSEKRLKINDEAKKIKQKNVEKVAQGKSVATAKYNEATSNTAAKNVFSSNNKAKIVKPVQKPADSNNKLKPSNKNVEKPSNGTKIPRKEIGKSVARVTGKVTSVASKDNLRESVASKSTTAESKDNTETISVSSIINSSKQTNAGNNVNCFTTSTPTIAKAATKKPTGKIITKDGGKVLKKGVSDSNVAQGVVKTLKKVASANNAGLTKKLLQNNVVSKKNDVPSVGIPKVLNKNVARAQNTNNKAPADKIKKPTNIKQSVENNKNMNDNPLRTLNKPSTKAPIASNTKAKAGNTEKENNSGTKISKIPQKKRPSQGLLKKVPLRISPRKPMPKPKMMSQAKANKKVEPMKKPTSSTSIPKFASKPTSMETA